MSSLNPNKATYVTPVRHGKSATMIETPEYGARLLPTHVFAVIDRLEDASDVVRIPRHVEMTGRPSRHVQVPRQELHGPSSQFDRLAGQGTLAQDAFQREIGFLPGRRQGKVGWG